jgi:hypothetical protein
VSRLVVVVPLRPGAKDAARRLLVEGPPFDLRATRFERHAVYLTDAEAVFVFEAPGETRTLELPAEQPSLWEAARAWREVMDGRPRIAETAFAWERSHDDGEQPETEGS